MAKNRTSKQRFLNMKGCASRKNKKGSRKMKGGCNSCFNNQMGGGNLMKGGKRKKTKRKKSCGCGKIPFFSGGNQRGGQMVGAPWSPSNTATWGNTNHFSLNPEINNPNNPDNIIQNRMNNTVPPHSAFSKQTGGKRMKKRGGGFSILPQDLVNLGRNFSFGVGSTYNALLGFPAPVNPLPYKDQMINSKFMPK